MRLLCPCHRCMLHYASHFHPARTARLHFRSGVTALYAVCMRAGLVFAVCESVLAGFRRSYGRRGQRSARPDEHGSDDGWLRSKRASTATDANAATGANAAAAAIPATAGCHWFLHRMWTAIEWIFLLCLWTASWPSSATTSKSEDGQKLSSKAEQKDPCIGCPLLNNAFTQLID